MKKLEQFKTALDSQSEAAPVSVSRPSVAIVGRQNVGKSTLLNRLAGKPVSIVEDLPGTTRDRIFADVNWQGVDFTMVDTGGLELEPRTTVSMAVRGQVWIAVADASVILFVVDAKDGVTPADMEIATLLRKAGKPLLLVVNKADNPRLEGEALEFFELGMGEPMVISAYHGRGVAELLDKLVTMLPEAPATPQAEVMKLAIVGRPGVGKSMLLNKLVGSQRVIVGDTPGTTRDAVDTRLDFDGESVVIIDTAGIRRRGKIQVGIERYSVARSLRAIDRADIALLVLDASEKATAQDTHIAGYVQQAAKGIVLIVNKWDLVKEENKADWKRYLESEFKFMTYAPVLFTSALTGKGTEEVLPVARQVYRERQKRVSTADLNNVLKRAVAIHSPPRAGTRRLKFFYATQPETNPPTFVFFVNDAKLLHFSYQRYIENRLRQAFGFMGTPLRLIFRTRGEP